VAWIVLCVAGLLEVGWASLLPATDGLRRVVPTTGFLFLLAGSMLGLAHATRTIPIGTAYVVWVGIGAVGTVLVGVLRGDPVTLVRLVFLGLVLVGVAGVRATSGH
jgi:quaternary ammonium compound-resistance protein SugE